MCYGSREFQQLKQMNKILENNLVDQDIFAGQWQQMRGTLKVWWGKLTDSDFERIGGQTDKLIGVLQEKYGYVRAQAQQEVERHLKEYGDTLRGPNRGWLQEATGAVATAATTVTSGLESAGSYLTRKPTLIWPPTSPPWCAATPSKP
jgi:uncharacterized protein YjbJ (UPF0337 family)